MAKKPTGRPKTTYKKKTPNLDTLMFDGRNSNILLSHLFNYGEDDWTEVLTNSLKHRRKKE